jgi:hypothetical protein
VTRWIAYLIVLWLCSGIHALAQNKRLKFGKGGDYLSIDNSPSLSGLQAFTIEAFVLFEAGGTENPRIFSKGWEANNGGLAHSRT